MAISVVMPALEMAQETGKLVSWLTKEGEQGKKGEMLLEVETDKAVVEIEAQSDGTLGGVTAKVGDVVPVGQTIAWLLKPGESVPRQAAPVQTGRTGAAAAPSASAPAGATAGPAPAAPGSAAGARTSPKSRKLAREHGVDIATVVGSGPGGEILADDVLRAAQRTTAPVAPVAPAPLAPIAPVAPTSGSAIAPDAITSIGRIMAERTTQSWTTVPHFFVSRDVDASALNGARKALVPVVEKSHGVKATHTDLLVAAVARALRQHPRMNASWSNGSITLNQDVNVALAMAVENAVITAVIRNADNIGLGDIAKQRVQPMMNLTLSSDHRLIDGARAAQFLNDVVSLVGNAGALT